MADNIIEEREDSDLFFNGRIIELPNGNKLLERDLIPYSQTQPDQYHTVRQGETITQIAWKYYQKFTENPSRYWKFIADVNKILNPLDLTEYVGKNIVIPDYKLIRLSDG